MKCFSFNVKDTFFLFLVTGLFISISGHAQNFTTNADGNWSNEGNWDRTNPNGCGTLANYPRTSTYDPQCQVDVTIEHHINFDVNTTFGGGYFKSLTVSGPNGLVTFPGNLTFDQSGSSLPEPNNVVINVTNGGMIDVSNGSLLMNRGGVLNITGNSTVIVRDLVLQGNNAEINVEEGSELIVLNKVTVNSGTDLNIRGNLITEKLDFASGGNVSAFENGNIQVTDNLKLANGNLTLNENSNIQVGGNISMSGGSQFNINENSSVNLEGDFNLENGNLNLSGYGDVSVAGNFKFQNGGGGVLNMQDNSYIHTEGNLQINWHTANLSDNAIFTADGNTVGNSGNVQKGGNACFNTANEPSSSPCARVLPVIFDKIEGILKPTRTIEIYWSVYDENALDGYKIESSFNGIKNFTVAGEVSGAGWSDDLRSYTFEDDDLPLEAGRMYYRIKQIDLNGNTTYSKIIAIDIPAAKAAQNRWQIYPNPANGQQVSLAFNAYEKYPHEEVVITLYNSLNQARTFKADNLEMLNSRLRGKLTYFSKGLLVIEIRWKDQQQHLKLML